MNKKKIFFDIDKARKEAKQLAIEKEQTYSIFKEGKGISITDAGTALANGYDVIEMVSKYL